MPKKRRNNGRNKNNRGKTTKIVCNNCSRFCPKDKAIKKFTCKPLIEAASRTDIVENSIYEKFVIPFVYNKLYYCVSCAVHSRIVRVRSTEDKKKRNVLKKLDKPLMPKKEQVSN